MPTALPESSYFYSAMTNAGQKRMGVRTAVDEADLTARLQKENLLLLKATKLPLGSAPPASLPLKDEAALNEQIRVLLSRGVPLVEALEVASSVVSSKSGPRIEALRERVAAGASFAQACEEAGGFDEVAVAVYRSAERSGDLAGAAERLETAAVRRMALAGKIVTVMIYPAIVLIVATLLMGVLLIFLVPTMADQIRQLNPDIPWYSEAVFWFGEFLRGNVAAVAVGVGVLGAAALLARKPIAAGLGLLTRSAPLVKDLVLRIEMARFFSVMAAMTKSGVPLAEALRTSSAVITNPKLRTQLESMQTKLVEGGVLSNLVEDVDALPIATRRLLVAADRAGDMDTAFDSLAEATSEEVDKRTGVLTAVLEPAMIVGVFMFIAPLIIAVAIPMFTARTGSQ